MIPDDVNVLEASWNNLVFFNYELSQDLLKPYLPFNTSLDLYHDKCYISLVGFLFNDAKVLNLSIPFHQKFEEVNLRFYVKRLSAEGYTRGVCFIRELVPSPLVAKAANFLYGENYKIVKMDHEIVREMVGEGHAISVRHKWKQDGEWNFLYAKGGGDHFYATPNSFEEFVVHRDRGYSRYKDGKTLEYEVNHPNWRLWPVLQYSLHITSASIFGEEFSEIFKMSPASVILAEGSSVEMKKGKIIH